MVGALLAAVLIPTACVLWFMNEAASSLALAARQTVTDASRSQLRSIRLRLSDEWSRRARLLDAAPDESPAAHSDRLTQSGAADGLVVLDRSGAAVRPRGLEPSSDGSEAAELARDFLKRHSPRRDLEGLQPTQLPGVWQLVSADRRAIGLFRDETVHGITHRVIDEHQSDAVHFAVFKPDEGAFDDALLIGHAMPGWQVSFTLLDIGALDPSARARLASYVWVGVLGAGLFALVLVGVVHTVQRQLRLSRLKTDLVASVSHELRTPLASMRLLVEGLLRDKELDPDKTREYLNLIAAENGRLSRLIENFLTFSRLERSRQPFIFEPVPPAEVVEAAVSAIRDRLHPGCEIEVEIEPDLPALHADAEALTAALVNLLDNACKYTSDDKRIRLQVRSDDGNVLMAVHDNGIGISAAEQKRIFRRFYRVDRRLSRDTSGVGLGLSIVDDIARAHGGDVKVTSQPGEGSTFTVRVPVAAGARA
jgi:signal transduction histidine kinase